MNDKREYTSIYAQLIDQAYITNQIKIDLPNKCIYVHGSKVVGYNPKSNEVYICNQYKDLPLLPQDMVTTEWQDILEKLYHQFETSIPSTHEKKSAFKCKCADDLEDIHLIFGKPRNVARVELETYVVLAVLSNLIQWEDKTKFFWHSDKHKALYVYRNWVMLDETQFKLR